MTTTKPKLQNIDPHLLEIPAVRIDSAFEDDVLAMFQDDVKKTGIEQALLVGKSDGRLWVIDGRHRLEQALLNRFPTVPCIVREMDLKTIQMRNLVSNRLRGKAKLSEEIKVVGDLYASHGATIDEIVEKTGMSRPRLETMILITQAHPEVLINLDEDNITFAQATQVIRLKDHEAQHSMLMSVRQFKPRAVDLKKWIDESITEIQALKEARATAVPQPPPAVATSACSCCQQDFPRTQLSAPSLCRSCYSLLIQAWTEVQKLEVATAREKAAKGVPEAGPPSAGGGGL